MSGETHVSTEERSFLSLVRRYPLETLWRLLASPAAARIWLTCLLVATIAGALIPQAPPEANGDPTSYRRWLATVITPYGVWGEPLSRLGLFNLRTAVLYRGLWGLATLSLLLVGWEQVRPRWRAFRTVPSQATLSSLVPNVSESELRSDGSPHPVAEAAATYLRSEGYRVWCDRSSDGSARIAGQRQGRAWLGPIVLHSGLLVLLLSFVLNQQWGWREGPFTLVAGSTYHLRHGSGLVLRLEDVSGSDDTAGSPGDLRGVLSLRQGQQPWRAIQVSSRAPAVCRGLTVCQTETGLAARVSLRDAAGESIALEPLDFSGGAQREILTLLKEGQSELWVGASLRGIALRVSGFEAEQGSAQGDSTLRLRAYRENETEPFVDRSFRGNGLAEVDGATCHVSVEPYASLAVAWSPGLLFSAVGALLALLGLCVASGPHPRCVWLEIEAGGRRRGSRILVATAGKGMALWGSALLEGLRSVLSAA